MSHSVTLSGTFGLSSAHPTSLTLQVVFTEFNINPTAGTSSVKAVITIRNSADFIERYYRYTDGKVAVTVAGRTQTIKGTHAFFDIGSHRVATLATLTWTGVNHVSGSCAVSMSGSWPTGTGGHGTVGTHSGTLALSNNLPCAPVAPKWVGSPVAGSGTAVLTWVNMSNQAADGTYRNNAYSNLVLTVEQAQYPDLFSPANVVASNVAGGKLHLANYWVQTYWNTSQGNTAPSTELFLANVPANHVIVVQPPANPPAIASGWSVGVTNQGSGKETVQKSKIGLTTKWTEPVAGLIKGAPMPSSPFDNALYAWQPSTSINIASPSTASTVSVPTVGAMWYQFRLTAYNNSAKAGVSTSIVTYYSGGNPPTGGNSSSGSTGESNANVVISPQANVGAVYATALNSVNASASVTPTVADVLNLSTHASALTAGSGLSLTNYCGDPRNYWLTANTTGNNTASPFVVEVGRTDFSSHNATVLPTQMSYALAAIGLAAVDRGIEFTFTNSTAGANTTTAIYLGGNTAAANANYSFPVPAGMNSVQVSFLAWANSSTVPGTRTPISALAFNALAANGASLGTNSQAQAAISVNSLVTYAASWALPANSASVVVTAVGQTTANTAAWTGGFQAGDTLSATAFMLGFNQEALQPFFDGGWPVAGQNILDGGDLALVVSPGNIPNSMDGDGGVLP